MIRTAKYEEAEAIQSLILRYTENGQMLYRALPEIQANIGDFLVYIEDGKVVGICSLKFGWGKLVEIRSLCVDPAYYRQGIGSCLVNECVDRALQTTNESIFVLTYAVQLFEKLGFKAVEKTTLPMKVWNDCTGCLHQDHCDETAMVLPLGTPKKVEPAPVQNTEYLPHC